MDSTWYMLHMPRSTGRSSATGAVLPEQHLATKLWNFGQVPRMPGVPMGNMTHVNIQHEAACDSIPAADVRAIALLRSLGLALGLAPTGARHEQPRVQSALLRRDPLEHCWLEPSKAFQVASA